MFTHLQIHMDMQGCATPTLSSADNYSVPILVTSVIALKTKQNKTKTVECLSYLSRVFFYIWLEL